MSRKRWREDPSASHREPAYNRSYGDEYRRRRYPPPTESTQGRSFNYWREEAVAPTSYYPQRSSRREDCDEQWRGAGRSWRHESSYPQRGGDSGPDRDQESRRGRSLPPQRNFPSQRHSESTHTPPPYIPRPTLRPRSPVESTLPPPKPVPPVTRRKTSPSPSIPSQPPKPSQAYLSLSQELSQVLRDPRSTRKLLVLDLNGTLLIRSPRSRTSPETQLRPVQPRPYMQSFRQYLFCPETKAWLDTMVWSSAQPHSVDDMVDKVFGAAKSELKAVWNRKSLGLSEADYHRKAVTTKDLSKPWNSLSPGLGPDSLQGNSAVPSESQVAHSALTTLLLDDSPRKAALQPYNHVCIPEYDKERRQHDLRHFLATREAKDDKRKKKAKQRSQVETPSHSSGQVVPELPPGGALSQLTEKGSYDATLLGVVGILDTIRLQSNVAGWIRRGGLWAAQEGLGETASNTVVGTGNDATSTSDPGVTPEQTHLQTKMWFDDSSVVAYWVARGRRTLTELGIPALHGVTG